jgi:hypothetical protein
MPRMTAGWVVRGGCGRAVRRTDGETRQHADGGGCGGEPGGDAAGDVGLVMPGIREPGLCQVRAREREAVGSIQEEGNADTGS